MDWWSLAYVLSKMKIFLSSVVFYFFYIVHFAFGTTFCLANPIETETCMVCDVTYSLLSVGIWRQNMQCMAT